MNEIVLAAARMAAKQLHEAKSDKGKTSIADIFDAFLEHIDEQATQIATLKAALICEHITRSEEGGWSRTKKEAIRYLTLDYPKISWKEKACDPET